MTGLSEVIPAERHPSPVPCFCPQSASKSPLYGVSEDQSANRVTRSCAALLGLLLSDLSEVPATELRSSGLMSQPRRVPAAGLAGITAGWCAVVTATLESRHRTRRGFGAGAYPVFTAAESPVRIVLTPGHRQFATLRIPSWSVASEVAIVASICASSALRSWAIQIGNVPCLHRRNRPAFALAGNDAGGARLPGV